MGKAMKASHVFSEAGFGALLLFVLTFSAYAADSETNNSPLEQGHGTRVQASPDSARNPTNACARLSIESALRAALSAVHGKVCLGEPGGVIVVRWMQDDEWLIELQKHSDVPDGHLQIAVRTNQVIGITNGKTGRSEREWVSSAHASRSSNDRVITPELAFQKGLSAGAPEDLNILRDTRGRIKLSRTSDDRAWFMAISGYRELHLGGTWITIRDDGSTEVMGGL